ncbi:MAG: glycosyltransferase family 9 protein [Paludibacteraceae bacterium]|nr:glycosyltransferase family 9 protein [Paludibacteraceae bacterium]
MTYLIIRLATLGNVAMTVPVIASLSSRYPDDRFIIASKKKLGAMFASMPNVEFREVDNHITWQGIVQLWRDWKKEIDHVIDLQDSPQTRLLDGLMRMSGTNVTRIQYGRFRKWMACFLGVKGELKSEFQRYQDTFLKAGLETDDSFTAIPIDATAAMHIEQRYGKKEGQWIGIAPFAKYRSNMLPYRVTKEIIQRMSSQPNTRVFLFGAGEIECEMLRQWASVFQHTESIAGRLQLSEELELMRQLDVMICMDSANQHLSSLVNLRAVSVWCATHPIIGFKGWKQSEENIIQVNDLRCRPCTCHGTNYCKYGNFACRQINAETIIKHI